MIVLMNKAAIITNYEDGLSIRAIAKKLGLNIKTVNKYVKKYIEDSNNLKIVSLSEDTTALRAAQTSYYSLLLITLNKRFKRKLTDEIDELIDSLLDKESIKTLKLGSTHKQALSATQIHQIIVDAGFDIGLTTITNTIKIKKNKLKETFIRQTYSYGQRLEFDFGEIKLMINGILEAFYIAVFGAPASDYRRAYLYKRLTEIVNSA